MHFYISTSANLSPTANRVYFSSVAGRYHGQVTKTGVDENSSVLRGTIRAILQGLDTIKNGFGTTETHRVDVLVPDQTTCEQLRENTSLSKILKGQDDNLWDLLLAQKAIFDLNFVSTPDDSKHLQTIWAWSATPPQPADLDGI